MSYQVGQGNIFSRVGTGLAQGLSEALPREMERGRLSQAMQNVKNMQGASPFEQFAAVAPLMANNPQLLQNTTELLRQQGIRNAYRQSAGQNVNPLAGQPINPESAGTQPNIKNVQFGQKPGVSVAPQQQQAPQQVLPTGFATRGAEVAANPPAASDNPLSPQYQPKPVWDQGMNDRAINEAFDRGIATNMNEAMQYANNQERIYNAASPAERANYEYKRGVDQQVDDLFDKQLQDRLQKKDANTYADVSGDLQLDLKKQAKNDVATGKRTPQEAAEYYSKAALDLGKQKKIFEKLANPSLDEYFIPSKKNERVKEYITMGDEFAKFGHAAQEEYYNMLINEKTGPGLSPGGAALLAYPRSKDVKSVINDAKLRSAGVKDSTQQAVRLADDILNTIKPNDSILAIARELYTKFPSFDERSFFDYIRENKDRWPGNPNFAREMEEGVSDIFSNWGDIGLFPVTGLSPAHK